MATHTPQNWKAIFQNQPEKKIATLSQPGENRNFQLSPNYGLTYDSRSLQDISGAFRFHWTASSL